jgi:hypothetical protein
VQVNNVYSRAPMKLELLERRAPKKSTTSGTSGGKQRAAIR